MDSFKIYTSNIQGFTDSLVIITTATYRTPNYPLGEAFVIYKDEQPIQENFRFVLDRDNFSAPPINSSADFLHEEALNEAIKFIDSKLFEKYTDQEKLAPIYKIVEAENGEREILRHQIRGHLTQAIQDIKNITNSQNLKTYLNTISGLKPYTVENF